MHVRCSSVTKLRRILNNMCWVFFFLSLSLSTSLPTLKKTLKEICLRNKILINIKKSRTKKLRLCFMSFAVLQLQGSYLNVMSRGLLNHFSISSNFASPGNGEIGNTQRYSSDAKYLKYMRYSNSVTHPTIKFGNTVSNATVLFRL